MRSWNKVCIFVVLATNDNSNMIEYSLVSDGVRVMNVLEGLCAVATGYFEVPTCIQYCIYPVCCLQNLLTLDADCAYKYGINM